MSNFVAGFKTQSPLLSLEEAEGCCCCSVRGKCGQGFALLGSLCPSCAAGCELSPCPAARAERRRSRRPFPRVFRGGCHRLGGSRGSRGSVPGCAVVAALLGRWPVPAGSGVAVLERPRGSACRWRCLRGAGARCGAAGAKGAPPQGTPSSLRCPGLPKEPQPPREAGDVACEGSRTRLCCLASAHRAAGVLRLGRMEAIPAGRLPVTSYPAAFPLPFLLLRTPCASRLWKSLCPLGAPPVPAPAPLSLAEERGLVPCGAEGLGSSANSWQLCST